MTAQDEPWDDASFRAFRDRLQVELSGFVDEQALRLAPLGADVADLVDEARVCVGGGKRFRAAFCWWGYHAVTDPAPDETALLRACAALEILHASALVHDDFMDGSDTRRGRPTTHVRFAERHAGAGWRGRSSSYGAAAAVLLGDLLLSWADELLRRSGLPTERVAEALEWFDQTRSEVIAGQFLDVTAQARGGDDVETSMKVLRYKSAKYSVERPLHIGAALAGGSASVQEALSRFGLPLGEAFQLRDDLLGVYGDPGATGKPAGDDLVEGKRTVLVALAAQGVTPDEAALLDRCLGTDLSPTDVDRLAAIIESSGAAAKVEGMIDDLSTEALAALAEAPIRERARTVLAGLARAATHRSV